MKARWIVLALVAICIAVAIYMFYAISSMRNLSPGSTHTVDINSGEAKAQSEWRISDLTISGYCWFTDAAAVCQNNLFIASSETDPQRKSGIYDLVFSVVSTGGNTQAPAVFQKKANYVIQSSSGPFISSMDSTSNKVYILFQYNGKNIFGRSNSPLPTSINDWIFEPLTANTKPIVITKLKCTDQYAFISYYSATDYSVYLMYKNLRRESAKWKQLLIKSKAVSDGNSGYTSVDMAIAGDDLCIFYNVEESSIDIDLMYAVVSVSSPENVLWRDYVWNSNSKCKWAASAANDDYVAGIFRIRESNTLFVSWLESEQLTRGNPWHISPIETSNRVGGSACIGISGNILEVVYRDLDSNSLVCGSIPVGRQNVLAPSKEVLESEHNSGTGIRYLQTSAYEVVVIGEGLTMGPIKLAYKPLEE
jgi:hypothetical protein